MSGPGNMDDGEILRRTSRTFALSMQTLPRAMREPVEVAYLLARTADTIADTQLAPAGHRRVLLGGLREAVAAGEGDPSGIAALAAGPADESEGAAPRAEAALLGRVEDLLDRFRRLEPADRSDVAEVVIRLISTMDGELAWFSPGIPGGAIRAWPDGRALTAYTNGIAGCVGPFWTRLVHRHVAPLPRARRRMMEAESRRYGRGLQLVNILRDLPRDLRRGVCFLPEEGLRSYGLAPPDLLEPRAAKLLGPLLAGYRVLARRNLLAGLAYTARLPLRAFSVRVATALPAALGLRTLALLETAAERADPARPVKLSRGQVKIIALRTALWSVCPKGPLRLV